jgi:hypothetical protein
MRTLAIWAVVYSVVALGSAFVHQCGHGVGAMVDGIHISTGVASAGDRARGASWKREPPHDPQPGLGRLEDPAGLGGANHSVKMV